MSTSVTGTQDILQNMLDQFGLKSDKAVNENDLNKDAFLNLLTTQMQYQDPLEPTKNEDFLAQMAQFTSLEQMQNLNTSFSMQQAYSLVGENVIGLFTNEVTGESEYVTGTVEAVTLRSGEAYVTVDGKEFLASAVEAVTNDTSSKDSVAEALADINESLADIQEKLAALTGETEETVETAGEEAATETATDNQ